MGRVYLDHNATTPLRNEARDAMITAMDVIGNPSSVHAEGRAAKGLVEKARRQVAQATGAMNADIIFVSGATEAASLALAGRELVGSALEHEAVLSWVDPTLDVVAGHVQVKEPARSVLQLANSETGLVQDLPEGGGQEMGRRSGTENVIAIAGFGAACAAAQQDLDAGIWDQISEFRNILETALEAAANDTIFVGKAAKRLPNTTCMISPGWQGETQVMAMDLAGFAVSAGSACSSGKVKASKVLQALGYDDTAAACAIRVSLGAETTKDDVLRFADAWIAKRTKVRGTTAAA